MYLTLPCLKQPRSFLLSFHHGRDYGCTNDLMSPYLAHFSLNLNQAFSSGWQAPRELNSPLSFAALVAHRYQPSTGQNSAY